MRKILSQCCFFLSLLVFLPSCSLIDACFNSHLAQQGKKYKSYGKSKSGSKSLSSSKYKHGKVKSSDVRKYDAKGNPLPAYAANLEKTNGTKVYSKAQLKAIERQNKKLHKHHKGGKGKFRYPYQIASPYSKEDLKKEKSANKTKVDKSKKESTAKSEEKKKKE